MQTKLNISQLGIQIFHILCHINQQIIGHQKYSSFAMFFKWIIYELFNTFVSSNVFSIFSDSVLHILIPSSVYKYKTWVLHTCNNLRDILVNSFRKCSRWDSNQKKHVKALIIFPIRKGFTLIIVIRPFKLDGIFPLKKLANHIRVSLSLPDEEIANFPFEELLFIWEMERKISFLSCDLLLYALLFLMKN